MQYEDYEPTPVNRGIRQGDRIPPRLFTLTRPRNVQKTSLVMERISKTENKWRIRWSWSKDRPPKTITINKYYKLEINHNWMDKTCRRHSANNQKFSKTKSFLNVYLLKYLTTVGFWCSNIDSHKTTNQQINDTKSKGKSDDGHFLERQKNKELLNWNGIYSKMEYKNNTMETMVEKV